MNLLSRDTFRESVFSRDSHKCVVCGSPAQDAHHIMERRLFADGGYYLDNGAALCGPHHLEAESTQLSCEAIRTAAGISSIILPDHLYRDYEYDKWGNIMLPNGTRLRGELFYDESVQKILKGNFTKYVKYPRTYHVPWSTLGKDDRALLDDQHFLEKQVVVTLKMDGENTTMYNDYIHARSLENNPHPSRDWVKGLWSRISWMLDDNMRVCGENLYAVHSLRYQNLPSYFAMFSFWIDQTCVSWEETCEYASILGVNMVPVIYHGIYDRQLIEEAFKNYPEDEGYVIRLSGDFSYGAFRTSVAKYVRPEFRQRVNNSHGHWISKRVEVNGLVAD